MTVAICLRCGARKIGALVVCPQCAFDPHASPEESARSIFLSDHHMDEAALAEAARVIQSGARPVFDEAKVAEMAQVIGTVGPVPLGCLVATWAPIIVMLGLVGVLVYLWLNRSP